MFSKVAASSDFIYGTTVGELEPAARHRAIATARPPRAQRAATVPTPRVESVADRVERFSSLTLARYGSYAARI